MEQVDSHLSFFGFREQPFAPTADPAYFYATRSHKECLFHVWNSIDERHGIAVVLGNYGTGKTTLLRKLMTGMAADRDRYITAVIGSPVPSWTSFALLKAVVVQFGLRPPKESFVTYMEALNRYLLANRDRICTLIIDDAQNLNKRGQVELLRLIQNLETPRHKLLNLVFFAQLEWMKVLRAAPNFEQRINMAYTLLPIAFEDTRHFIEFRIKQAGGEEDLAPVFDGDALKAIHAYAEGSPRVIVTLCRNALLLAGRTRVRNIGQEMVLHTIEKTTVPDPEKRARAAATSTKEPRPQAGSAPGGTPAPVYEEQPERPSGRRRHDERDERASRLLLNAARTKQDPGGSGLPQGRSEERE